MALLFYRGGVLDLNSYTPFPGGPDLIASRTYSVRGILFGRAQMLDEMYRLEQVCIKFLGPSLSGVDSR